MKIRKLDEAEEKNIHQRHYEDLVFLGQRGFDRLKSYLTQFKKTLEGEDVGLNTTVKIDGAPAVICWHKFEGYPDDSVALKSFVGGPEKVKAFSSVHDLQNSKWADNNKVFEMLTYCLDIAKQIPSGEAWQGDCLFVNDMKKEVTIGGKDCITFKPNTITYAFSEDNPGYEEVKNADFGIAFHTIYYGDPYDVSQKFRVDVTKLNLPSNIYVLSPALNASKDKKDYNFDKVDKLLQDLNKIENDLVNDPAYEELIRKTDKGRENEFIKFFSTFENNRYADNKLYNINIDTLIDELVAHLERRAPKMSKVGVTRLTNTIENNKKTITNIVKALNLATEIKMLLLGGFTNTSKFGYSAFYHPEGTDEYTPTSMEGIAMSDADGNIVKLVDRPVFAANNRNIAYSAFSKNTATESLTEAKGKKAVIAFGRLNPPTIGHKKLVDKMAELANGNAEAKLYLSHTQDKKKNPLSYEQKIKWAKKFFEPEVEVVETELKSAIEIITQLYSDGYTDIVYVGGSDRIGGKEDMTSLIKKYDVGREEGTTTKDGRTLYNFGEDHLTFEKVPEERQEYDYDYIKEHEDELDLSTVASASLARECVKRKDFDLFKKLVPVNSNEAEQMFNEIKAGLNLTENLIEGWQDFEKTTVDYLNELFKDDETINFEAAGANDSTVSDVICKKDGKIKFYIECKNTPANGSTIQMACRTDSEGQHPYFSPSKSKKDSRVNNSPAAKEVISALNDNIEINNQFDRKTKNRIQINSSNNTATLTEAEGGKTIFIQDDNIIDSMREIFDDSYSSLHKNAPIIAVNSGNNLPIIGETTSDVITVSHVTVRPKVDYPSNISKDISREKLIDELLSRGYINKKEDALSYDRMKSKKDFKVLFRNTGPNKLSIKHTAESWPQININLSEDTEEKYLITPTVLRPYETDPGYEPNLKPWLSNKENEEIFQIKKVSVRKAYMRDSTINLNENSKVVVYNDDPEYIKDLILSYL